MKQIILALIIVAFCLPLLAQKGEDITGTWFNGEKISQIQIYKTTAGNYAGKLVWLKEPKDENGKAKVDGKNPDKKLQDRALMDLVILTGLDYKGKNKYEGGKIYDPQSGKSYSCKAELADKNTLKLRGFIGISLVGRTDTWTRAK